MSFCKKMLQQAQLGRDQGRRNAGNKPQWPCSMQMHPWQTDVMMKLSLKLHLFNLYARYQCRNDPSGSATNCSEIKSLRQQGVCSMNTYSHAHINQKCTEIFCECQLKEIKVSIDGVHNECNRDKETVKLPFTAGTCRFTTRHATGGLLTLPKPETAGQNHFMKEWNSSQMMSLNRRTWPIFKSDEKTTTSRDIPFMNGPWMDLESCGDDILMERGQT